MKNFSMSVPDRQSAVGSLTLHLTFRCSDRLYDLVLAESQKVGISVSDYIRGCLWRSVGSALIRGEITDTVIQESLKEGHKDADS